MHGAIRCMGHTGQRSFTIGAKTHKKLKEEYERELHEREYPISFAQFVLSHALEDIARTRKEKEGKKMK